MGLTNFNGNFEKWRNKRRAHKFNINLNFKKVKR
jgi:hypothetical protein